MYMKRKVKYACGGDESLVREPDLQYAEMEGVKPVMVIRLYTLLWGYETAIL